MEGIFWLVCKRKLQIWGWPWFCVWDSKIEQALKWLSGDYYLLSTSLHITLRRALLFNTPGPNPFMCNPFPTITKAAMYFSHATLQKSVVLLLAWYLRDNPTMTNKQSHIDQKTSFSVPPLQLCINIKKSCNKQSQRSEVVSRTWAEDGYRKAKLINSKSKIVAHVHGLKLQKIAEVAKPTRRVARDAWTLYLQRYVPVSFSASVPKFSPATKVGANFTTSPFLWKLCTQKLPSTQDKGFSWGSPHWCPKLSCGYYELLEKMPLTSFRFQAGNKKSSQGQEVQ